MKLSKNTNTLLPLCKDCRHSKIQQLLSRCLRPTGETNLVTGEQGVVNRYCSNERYGGWYESWLFELCGKEGRYFESKVLVPSDNESKENVID